MRRSALAGVALLAAWLLPAVASADTTGASLQGTWDVVRVAVDPADQPRWTWRPDDPRLLGRELVVGVQALLLDGDSARCDMPRWTLQPSTWAKLLPASFPRPPRPGRASAPTAAELGLVSSGGPITLLRPACSAGADGRVAAPWDDSWLVQTAPDRLVMRHGQALVHLARRNQAGPPRASFACTAAASASEQAICSSVPLAAWDRSVAQAWREARKRRADDSARLQTEQRSWLQERNRCGADLACLRARMQERVDALVQE
jgi:uncharacterized protein YecT (DUF1311 family)